MTLLACVINLPADQFSRHPPLALPRSPINAGIFEIHEVGLKWIFGVGHSLTSRSEKG